ncbi:MAG TPA: wax ester/triacylglycerol synthase family O-acyltransferase [Burkholderiaceae bacterium]|nr:wax ester/triacylglycerol synthase family O-acyltransferase [Burkholderiaceae bacterium]
MTTVRLNPLDASWLYTESRDTPMHVGALMPFRLPQGAPPDLLRRWMADFRKQRKFAPPWNRRLKSHLLLKSPVHYWVEDDDIDLEAHLRHTALPNPGGERELGELIARLHSQPLDLSRPPWECTLIEGLEGGRFAMYIKMHHSLIDGVSGVKLLQRVLSTDPARSLDAPPFWAIGAGARKPERDTDAPSFSNALAGALTALRGQVGTVPQLLLAFAKMLRLTKDVDTDLRVPFGAPGAIINGRVRAKRRFATQQFELERMKALATAAGCTINDLVLATCGGALRRFLDDSGDLPDAALTAGIPVSVRPKDDEGTGNAITFIIATLGTDIDDPLERLAAVRTSVRAAKEHVQSLPRAAMTQYTVALMGPTILALLTGLGGRARPVFNVTISNVPGPDKPLYFRGAELLATYPVSIVTHGQALNITCHSYAGQMAFGFTGCHATLPHLQRIAVYTGEAFEELERLILAPKKPKRKTAPRKRSR